MKELQNSKTIEKLNFHKHPKIQEKIYLTIIDKINYIQIIQIRYMELQYQNIDA